MQEKDLVAYLKANKGYQRILEVIIKKYKSLGKLGGRIELSTLSDEEVKILSAYDYRVSETRTCSIQVKKFIEGLCAGKFANVDFEETLKLYSASDLMSHKEVKQKKQEKSQQFYKQLNEKLTNVTVKRWLEETLAQKQYGYHTIHKLYNKNQTKLKKILLAIDALEQYRLKYKEWILLPVLASQITGDTHYFDLNKVEGKILLYFFSYKQDCLYPTHIQEMNEMLTEEKIVRDQISNTTACYGIYGKTKEQEKPWEAFWEMGEPLQLSLYNIKDVKQMAAKGNKVYIVENPAVFVKLLEVAIKKNVGLICTSGQLNTSSYIILDLLEAAGVEMYYNGDYDPEGIQIADQLKQRYQGLNLWCYDKQHYLKVKSEVSIEERLGKLKNIQSQEFTELIEVINKEKMAGYQELLVETLIENM